MHTVIAALFMNMATITPYCTVIEMQVSLYSHDDVPHTVGMYKRCTLLPLAKTPLLPGRGSVCCLYIGQK